MKLLIFLSILLASLAGQAMAQAPAQISVSPDVFRIDIDDNRPHSLTVMNLSDRTIEATTSVSGWTLENDQVVPTPPTPASLDQWIILNPVDMKIAPGESQVVRFAIRPSSEPKRGEHSAMLWIQEKHAAAPSRMVKARFRIGVAIYADKNPVERAGQFIAAHFEPDKNRLRLEFSNQGNAHDRPSGTVTLENRNNQQQAPITLSLPKRPILPGKKASQYVLLPSLPTGNYLLTLEGHFYDRQRVFQQQMEFRAP